MSKRIRWYDWAVYRLFWWRWNPILRDNAAMRAFFMAYMRGYEMQAEQESAALSRKDDA